MSTHSSKDELEQQLLNDKVFQHILKLTPYSQREFMTFELAEYFHKFITQHTDRIVAEVIGEDDKPQWDSEEWFCDKCAFQPSDGTKNCICIFRNKLRAAQRQRYNKIKGDK